MGFQFDPSIILQQNTAGSAQQARSWADMLQAGQQMRHNQMTMAEMLRQQQDGTRLADIYRQNAGSFQGPLAQALAGGGFGAQAYQAEDQSSQMQAAQAQRQKVMADLVEQGKKQLGSLLWGTKDQADYEARLSAAPPQMRQMLPQSWEQARPLVESYALPPEKRADLSARAEESEKGRAFKREESAKDRIAARERATIMAGRLDANAASKAQNDLNEQVEKLSKRMENAPALVSDLSVLNEAMQQKDIPGVGVGYSAVPSFVGDWMASEEGLRVRQAAKGVVATYLKERSGTAASDAEVERTMSEMGMGKGASERDFRSAIPRLLSNLGGTLKAKEAGATPEAVKEARKRGLITSEDLPKTSGAKGGPKRISSDAEFEKLPAGAQFIGPDGKLRRKP
jgi:hypothetical protein